MVKKLSAAQKKWEDAFKKTHGDTLVLGGEVLPYEVISTGSLALDYKTGVGGLVEGRLTEYWGPDGIGKGHPVDTPILTPEGWRPIGEFIEGDLVIGSDGLSTRITGVYDRGVLNVFRVTFNDGASVLCDADHLWRVRAKKGWVTYSTRVLMEDKSLQDPEGWNRYRIPLVAAVQHDSVDLPIDPYLLGALLANGHLSGTPVIRTNDTHIIGRIEGVGEVTKEHTYANSTARGIAIHHLRDRLRVLNLYDTRSSSKFIPSVYLVAAETSRRALLAALLDADGSSGRRTEYHTTSSWLAEGVVALVRSLGGVARLRGYRREHPDGRSYSMFVVPILIGENPFTTPSKAAIWKSPTKLSRRMVSIEPEGQAEVRCIRVAADDSLYVTQDYIVTHNTTFALMAIREAQKKYPDKYAAYIDMEHKLDKPWAVAHGVDLDKLYIHTPDTAEDVADAMKDLVQDHISIVVLDSIGSMIPQAEIEKDAGDAVMAKVAKIVTRMVKIAAGRAAQTGTVVLLINQVRANLSYGATTTTGGGFALKHVTTMKMKFKRTGTEAFSIKVGPEKVVVGHEIAVFTERNGVAPAYRTAIVAMFNQPTEKYGSLGIDKADEAATLGLSLKLIDQAGAWYTMPGTGERLHGREEVVEALRVDPKLVEEVRRQALESIASQVLVDTEAPVDADVEVVQEDSGDKEEGPQFRSVADALSEDEA